MTNLQRFIWLNYSLLFQFNVLKYLGLGKDNLSSKKGFRNMADSKTEKENIDFLFQLVMLIETKEECAALFDALCTKTELATLSQRAVVAHMLEHKKVYSDIVAQTGASTATISRVNRTKEGYLPLFEKFDKM